MMYIAKMHTRYPEFHGKGYYNFLMEDSQEELDAKIEAYSHDYSHIKTVKTRFQSVEAITAKYPSKDKLNSRYFS